MRIARMSVIPAGEDPKDREVRWKYANFTDRFIFAAILEDDPEMTIKILKRFIPDIDIRSIEITPEKHIETSGLSRYVRLDIYATLQDGKKILIEMQVSAETDFVRRIRYYRSHNDVKSGRKGSRYGELPDVIQLSFCLFDPIGCGKAMYDFEYRDRETPEIKQNDGTRVIYLNVKGDMEGLNAEQRAFLEYLAGKAVEDELCCEVNEKVELLKYNDKKKDGYMLFEDVLREAEDKGREEGHSLGREETQRETVQRMYRNSFSIEQICLASGLTAEEVQGIIDSVDNG